MTDAKLTANQAAEYLDVKLTDRKGWLKSFTGRMFRLIDFEEKFESLAEHSDADSFEAEFVAAAKRIAKSQAQTTGRKRQKGGAAPWCVEGYSMAQLNYAKTGAPMMFDKAIITVLTFNDFVKQLATDKPKVPASQHENAGEEEVDEELPIVERIRRKSVICCGFVFPELGRLVDLAAQEYAEKHKERVRKLDQTTDGRLAVARECVLKFLAEASGQNLGDVRSYARDGKAVTETGRTVSCASYPTMRSLYKALDAFPRVRQEYGDDDREKFIMLRVAGSSNAKPIDSEKIEQKVVTKPPFGWDHTAKPGWPEDEEYPSVFKWRGPDPDAPK